MTMTGISELIFLDRYAQKDPERRIQEGDTVVALVKDDPQFPQKGVGVVEKVDGENITVRLKDTGEVIVQHISKMEKPIELKPCDMWDRMAKAAAAIESPDRKAEMEERFRNILDNFRFSPGGRINVFLGTDQNLTAYNCYVIPIRDCETGETDSREAIIKTLGNMVELMARGGGVGINLSTLRPRLAPVAGVNGRSSGSVSWGGLFSFATGLVEQGGSRRGALMLILNDWHPDILEFVEAKRDMGAMTNANISVGVSNAFIEAVKNDEDWDLVFPDTSNEYYSEFWDGDIKRWKEIGGEVRVYKTIKARDLWDKMMESAWLSAEPGVVFLERMNDMSNSWYFETIHATNPCAEQPLPPWGVCNLGHINLSRFVTGPIGKGQFEWEELETVIRDSVRFLDNIIDITPYFLEENKIVQMNQRRIGLGTMGLGEALIRLGLRYGSDEAIDFVHKLYQVIANTAYQASATLAYEKGSFPKFEKEKFLQGKFVQRLNDTTLKMIEKYGMRNVALLTQAPTGSTGTMIGTSTGIEPYYSWTYWRKGRLGTNEVREKIVDEYFSENPHLEKEISNLPDYFVTAMELTPQEHLKMQAAIQQWTDSSISKTINLPKDYPLEACKELYIQAYDLGCKGVTIYRDGSRDEQVLSVDTKKEAEPPSTPWTSRPKVLMGATHEYATPVGKAFITINRLEDRLVEVFLNIGKAGSDVAAMSEALGRLTTLFLKYAALEEEAKLQLLVDHLSDIGGSNSIGMGPNRILSLPDAMSKVFKSYLGREAKGESDLCPSCGQASLIHKEGCYGCDNCGFSRC